MDLEFGLNFAYPVTLGVVLLAAHLVIFHKHDASPVVYEKSDVRTGFRIIWCLQAALCLILVLSSIGSLHTLILYYQTSEDARLVKAQLTAHVSVFLYFVAGLLPDPDGPFTPVVPNFYTWVTAIALEVAILLAAGLRIKSDNGGFLATTDIAQTLGGALKICLLLSMCGTFLRCQQLINKLSDPGGDCERLLGNGHANTPNYSSVVKSSASQPAPKADAQTTGWLDYLYGFRALFPYIWPSDSPKQQLVTVFCFILLVMQRIVNILVPWSLGVLVEALGYGHIPYREIAFYCLFRGLQGLQGIIGSFRAILWIPISQSLFQRLSCAAFEHVLNLSLDFHLSKQIGEVMSALSKGGALNTFLDGFAFQLFPMVFDLGVAAIYFAVNFDAFYAIIVVGAMWSYIFITIYMAKYRGRARREQALKERQMEAAKTDAIMSYETVHHNCAVQKETSKFRGLVKAFQGAEFSVLLSLNLLNATQNLVFILGVVFVSLLSAYKISIGAESVATFITIITYFAQLQAPLAFFGSFYNQVQNNLVDAERMLDLFNKHPQVVDAPDAVAYSSFTGKVAFKNVNFAYDARRPALKNISFEVEPGTSTAIVGQSGSGKSTVLKLLFRFYNVDGGSIEIDNVDVRKIKIQSLREHTGVVPQDTILFNDTLRYNIRYAKPDVADEEIFEACRAANLHHRILTFPQGYDTSVGERGLKLSGGEKQRVAIARAILKRPQIMLLDEATASLDSHTERLIQKELEDVTRNRTTITIAHRLSTITKADQIIVLHEGEIVERGTHSQLLALNGRYRAMWEKQTEAEQAKEKFQNTLETSSL